MSDEFIPWRSTIAVSIRTLKICLRKFGLRRYAALATFRFESSFYTWLRKITINCFLNHRRRRSPLFPWHEQLTATHTLSETETNSLEATLQNQLVVEKVMQALSAVTPQQRLVFLLKHQEGMTYQEIAGELGCSTGAVKKSVSRTITKLRETLGTSYESENYISCAATGIMS
jgi:RNA polymerase sigma-70 factor (ECF subfamily)